MDPRVSAMGYQEGRRERADGGSGTPVRVRGRGRQWPLARGYIRGLPSAAWSQSPLWAGFPAGGERGQKTTGSRRRCCATCGRAAPWKVEGPAKVERTGGSQASRGRCLGGGGHCCFNELGEVHTLTLALNPARTHAFATHGPDVCGRCMEQPPWLAGWRT